MTLKILVCAGLVITALPSFAQTTTPAPNQTLVVQPRTPSIPVFANGVPRDPITGTQYVEGLPPSRCADLLAQLPNDGLALAFQCQDGVPSSAPAQ